MKKRFKNWITTIMGIIIMMMATAMLIMNTFYEGTTAVWTIVLTYILGWVFLIAKDSLLEGLFLRVFNIPKK